VLVYILTIRQKLDKFTEISKNKGKTLEILKWLFGKKSSNIKLVGRCKDKL
jgi:hypothetical protein